jgi:TetR/AcrR family transcriptional regulator, cholesterol catabolism regulator
VGWYRPGGKLAIHDIARQYLSIVLDGIAEPNGDPRG